MINRNESFKEYLRFYPITTVIVALNLVMFVYTSAIGGLRNPSIVYEFGGIINSKIDDGEYYRILSYAFIHNGLTHLIFNMGAILLLAPPIEKILGKTKYILFFLICIFSTFLFIYFFSSGGVGASGFDFGLLGLFLFLILFRGKIVDSESKKVIITFILLGWISTLVMPAVSISGHLGGFIAGFLSGILFKIKHPSSQKNFIEKETHPFS
ncbi:MAG: rhomboid family intramembrane serine protease [Bacillota bacterium]|nr:rhomboid family intramembrane serine protease [Bacillota bacterium]